MRVLLVLPNGFIHSLILPSSVTHTHTHTPFAHLIRRRSTMAHSGKFLLLLSIDFWCKISQLYVVLPLAYSTKIITPLTSLCPRIGRHEYIVERIVFDAEGSNSAGGRRVVHESAARVSFSRRRIERRSAYVRATDKAWLLCGAVCVLAYRFELGRRAKQLHLTPVL